jgi:ABC-type transporter Mla subunit MlaD
MNRRGTSIAANPVLIGAATTLVVIVAVFLAYNANSGLPFVPTYDIKVQVPNAAGLVKGNDVRVGGTRVGTVSAITPRTLNNGKVVAVLSLKLDTTVKPLPTDTTIMVRPRSALGLKYVQLTRGSSQEGWDQGTTVSLANAHPKPVEIDQFFNMFDDATRRASQGNLTNFGNGLAGRGADLNFAIKDLNPLLDVFIPVFKNLGSDKTDLRGFFNGLAQAAGATAPVAEQNAQLFVGLDQTFRAWASVARPYLQETISEGPATLDAAIAELPHITPFLNRTAAMFTELQPGANALANAAPDLAAAESIGTPVLRNSPAFNAQVSDTFRALEKFSTDPMTKLGIADLTSTVDILAPTIRFITPAQTVCNYLGIFFRNAASVLSYGGDTGTVQRFSIVISPGSLTPAPNNEGSPSSAPANGGSSDQRNFLHSNPYPLTAAPGQPRSCEAANETYLKGRTVIGNVPGMAPTTLHENTAPAKAKASQ